jgi:hypothetical protein
MFFSGSVLPGRMSAVSPATMLSPTFSPAGCRMYRFSPSAYCTSAIRAERFGSYSTVTILPGMPILSRLKSMMRYSRRCPPPRHHAVISPWLLRPPDFFRCSVSGLNGFAEVISA